MAAVLYLIFVMKLIWVTHFFIATIICGTNSIQVDSFRNATCGSERSNQLELVAHLGSLYNYGKVDILL